LPFKRLADHSEFFEQAEINVAFTGLFGDKIPEVTDFLLADAVDATKSLFDPMGAHGKS